MKLYVNWDETSNFRVVGVQTDNPGGYNSEEFEVDFDLADGDQVYVLYMIYTTGDSYSTSPGNGDIIWVFKDKELGIAAGKKFKEHSEQRSHSKFSVNFEVDGGRNITLPNQAAGHFESLEKLELLTFGVNRNSSILF